ncbi:MAG TPA: MFS transporter [Phycisphaerae bacterium]|nr:MFS transporter [Phycisphaerales bacterium]HRX83912.1 MFS transporter [Phycisphaerae bacterium]
MTANSPSEHPSHDHPDSPRLSWRFPRTFWFANGAELFERAAYYGMFIEISLFLTSEIGFGDVAAGWIAGAFGSVIYLLPMFLGAMADAIGFRRSLMLAFGTLTAGYAVLGTAGTLVAGTLVCKLTAIVALLLIMFGGAIVKPVISATVAKCSDSAHRARAFSIFYAVVNIGAFTGKSVAAPVREFLGLEYIGFYAAVMALGAFVLVTLFYVEVKSEGIGRPAREVIAGLLKVFTHVRFLALILIVAGFWAIQGQLYATMPKYMIRLLGEGSKPEWFANINPAVVVLLVVPITHLVRQFRAENSIAIGLFIIPLSALSIALTPTVAAGIGDTVNLTSTFQLPTLALMVAIGIALQGLAECFLSPKFLEYASNQAPKGEEGLYLGYQHLTTFFAWLFGFALSGYLLDEYCPDPGTLSAASKVQYEAAMQGTAALPAEYAHANQLWYYFAVIGATAFCAIIVFKYVTRAIDRQRALRAR